MKKLLIFLIIFCAQLFVKGQGYIKVPNKLMPSASKKLLDGLYSGNVSLNELFNAGSGKENWIVYSDRSKNYFGNRSGTQQLGAFAFMEELLVLEYDRNRLKVKSKGDSRKVGWIKVDKLVLSMYSPITSTGIKEKGIVIVDSANFRTVKFPLGYMNPSSSKGRKIRDLELAVRMVLKKEIINGDTIYLVTSDEDFVGVKNSTISDRTYWLKSKNFLKWDTRVCIEIEHGNKPLDSYENLPIPIFSTEQAALAFGRSSQTTDSEPNGSIDYKILETRMSGEIMRMPVLRVLEDSVLEVATFIRADNVGRIVDNNFDEGDQKIGEIGNRLNIYKDRLRTIDVLLVIDGTKSMAPYMDDVKSAISSFIEVGPDVLDHFEEEVEIKYSLAVYRDTTQDGEDAFVFYDETEDIQEIKRNINSVVPFSLADDNYESSYNGMLKAIRKVDFKKWNSNIIILIGDAGNYRGNSEIKRKEHLIEELTHQDCSILAFQVKFGLHPAYLYYHTDAMDYLMSVGNSKIGAINNANLNYSLVLEQTQDKGGKYVELKFAKNGNDSKPYRTLGFGQFHFASINKKMGHKVLEKKVQTAMGDYLIALDSTVKRIEKIQYGNSYSRALEVDKVDVRSFINSTGNNISDEDINNFFNRGTLGTLKGYALKKYYGRNVECFRSIVFLTESERKKLRASFIDLRLVLQGKISDEGNNNTADQLSDFTNTLTIMARTVFGEHDMNLNNYTLNDVWLKAYGVEFGFVPVLKRDSTFFKVGEVKLGNIKDGVLKAEPKLFEKIRDVMLQQIEAFLRITAKKTSKNHIKYKDRRYYWVPLEAFPGSKRY